MFYAPRIRLDTEFIKQVKLNRTFPNKCGKISDCKKKEKNDEFVLLYFKFMLQLIYSCIFLSHERLEDAGCSYPEI